MLKQVVNQECYLYEVRKRAYLLWEERLWANHLADWRGAKIRASGLGRCRRKEDIRWLAYKLYEERLAKGPLDDWLEAERQISQYYEIAEIAA